MPAPVKLEWPEIRGTPTKTFRVEPLTEPLRKDHTDKRITELNTVFNKLENKTQKAVTSLKAVKQVNETLSWIEEYRADSQ